MRTDPRADADAILARELLRLCQCALARRQLAVAEHLLRAIEEMARAKPELAEIEQEAYLRIAQSAAATIRKRCHALNRQPAALGSAGAKDPPKRNFSADSEPDRLRQSRIGSGRASPAGTSARFQCEMGRAKS